MLMIHTVVAVPAAKYVIFGHQISEFECACINRSLVGVRTYVVIDNELYFLAIALDIDRILHNEATHAAGVVIAVHGLPFGTYPNQTGRYCRFV